MFQKKHVRIAGITAVAVLGLFFFWPNSDTEKSADLSLELLSTLGDASEVMVAEAEPLVEISNEQMTIEQFEIDIKDPKFKTSMVVEKDAVLLKIEDTELVLKSYEDANAVIIQTIEQLISPEHHLDIFIDVIDNKLTTVDFEHKEGVEDDCDAELISLSVMESVEIQNIKVSNTPILSVEDALALTTKSKDTPVMYTVKSGDVPSVIAQNNNMGLSLLYAYNPSLEDGDRPLQIGEELVVLVPKPEMTLKVIEQASYQASIPKSVVSKSDDSLYVGSTNVIDKGADGIKEVTAVIAKVNGNEISRSISGERTLREPVASIVAKGTKALPSKGAVGTYIYPLTDYTITSRFGSRWGRAHTGVDFAASIGTDVRASDGGVVTFSGWSNSYGYVITIDHGNGIETRYAHNSQLLVSSGEYVSQYQVIAKSGNTGNSTGPHCHFEFIINGVQVDPLKYLN